MAMNTLTPDAATDNPTLSARHHRPGDPGHFDDLVKTQGPRRGLQRSQRVQPGPAGRPGTLPAPFSRLSSSVTGRFMASTNLSVFLFDKLIGFLDKLTDLCLRYLRIRSYRNSLMIKAFCNN